MKKFVSLSLSIIILLSVLTGLNFSAYAINSSGSCGENASYTYTYSNGIGVITINGTGAISNYEVTNGLSSTASPFYACDATHIIINEGITRIGTAAFRNCASLINVEIPSTVTSIGDYSFSECKSLESISIPDTVETIGNNAFYDCWQLSSVKLSKNIDSINECLFYRCSRLLSIDIPENVKSIGNSSFSHCSSLKKISFHSSVTSIGSFAFHSCSSLNSVNTDNIESWLNITFTDEYSNPVRYSKSLIINEEEVKDLMIPEGKKTINDYAFYNCESLETIDIPDTVETIGARSFYGCNNVLYSVLKSKVIDTTQNLISTMPAESKTYAFSTTNAAIYSDIYGVNFIALNEKQCDTGVHFYADRITKKPTCTEKGLRKYKCVYCDEYYNEDIPENGHTPEVIEAIPPTCTKTGLTEGSYCTVCGETIVAQEVVPENGHAPETDEAVPPTCTKNGLTEGSHCSVCGETIVAQETVLRLFHDYETQVLKEAACGVRGETEYRCKNCGYSYISYTNALPHNYTTKTVEATCTNLGYTVYTCTVCGESYKANFVGLTGHTAVVDYGVPATFTADGLTEGSHCALCKKIIVAQKTIPKFRAAKLSKVKAGKKSFIATWPVVKGVDGYEIQYSLKKNMKSATTKNISGSAKKHLTVKKLKAKKTYYVRIRTYKTINGKKQYSAWSIVKTVKTKK